MEMEIFLNDLQFSLDGQGESSKSYAFSHHFTLWNETTLVNPVNSMLSPTRFHCWVKASSNSEKLVQVVHRIRRRWVMTGNSSQVISNEFSLPFSHVANCQFFSLPLPHHSIRFSLYPVREMSLRLHLGCRLKVYINQLWISQHTSKPKQFSFHSM